MSRGHKHSRGHNQSIRNNQRHLQKKKEGRYKVQEQIVAGGKLCVLCRQPFTRGDVVKNIRTVEFNGLPVMVHETCPGEEQVC